MLEQLPVIIEPLRLAEVGRQLHGRLPLAEFRRLAPALHEVRGEVEVDLEFGKDELHMACLRGHLHTRLQLICQRCLQPMALPVDAEFALGLVTTDEAADQLPADYEPLMVSGPMELAEIIEDELILAVPLVPMHPVGECPAQSGQEGRLEDKAPHPFAVLARLKKPQ